MRKFGLCGFLAATVAVSLFFFTKSNEAHARLQYKKQFEAVYPDVTANNKINCNVCHEGTKKQDRNEYGKALQKALESVTGSEVPKAGVKEEGQIKAALGKVAKDEAKFGDRLKAGKLPVE